MKPVLRGATIVALLSLIGFDAEAQQVSVTGFGDLRFVLPSDEESFLNGGLGKLRYGSDHAGGQFSISEIVADGKLVLSPDLSLRGTLRYAPDQQNVFDVIEAYAKYQPLSGGDWQFSAKTGAFFPPISLENESVGWTSPWTITPSAINSWIGDELRTIGVEPRIARRFGPVTIEATGAIFGWNEPAGVLMADHGWTFDDHPAGLMDTGREPNYFAMDYFRTSRLYTPLFREIDNSPGWYGEASAQLDGAGKISVLRYDNRADPSASQQGAHAWHTYFTSVGVEADLDETVLLLQALSGETDLVGYDYNVATKFQSAYLLVGRYLGDWRVAGRADVFGTQYAPEHGYAGTASLSWVPLRWLRIASELMRVHSFRTERLEEGTSPDSNQTQFQLLARVFF